MNLAAPLLEIVAAHPRTVGALLVLLALAGYITACAAWPFTACSRCDGTGKLRSPSGRAWRPCQRCTGTGTKLRAGRRAWAATRTRGHQDQQRKGRP